MAQAGFQFQGDVLGERSFAFPTAGQLMKKLSDGGIDPYTLNALAHLGQSIPMSQRQEAMVAASMEKRNRTRSGWLAKALSIGWAHNDAAYEISKMTGGCAALLTINAFAAGSNALGAAQGLRELLSLSGCEEDLLPAIDTLRDVVRALTPIMEDCGFQSVLETIHFSSISELGRLLPGAEFFEAKGRMMEDSGEPEDWADAVYQLYLTATTGQTIYIHTTTRGAWLAAYAVDLLEMDCAVMHHNHVLWQAAGSNGSVTIQIAFDAPKTQEAFAKCFSLNRIHETMQIVQYMESTYCLKEALNLELSKIPRLTPSCKQSIKTGIVQLITFLSTRKIFADQYMHPHSEVAGITGPFRTISGRIVCICEALGLDLQDLQAKVSRTLSTANQGFFMRLVRGDEVDILGDDNKAEIEEICYCDDHARERTQWGYPCLLDTISDIIAGFATTGFALLPCYLETVDIRVSAAIINGSSYKSKWLDTSIKSLTDSSQRVNLPMLLNHLRRLFHGENATELTKYAVAASGRGITIAIRALLDSEGFNDVGQYLGIYSGRLDHDGCIREVVEESGRWVGGGQSDDLVMPATVAPGVRFLPSDSEIFSRLEVSSQIKTKLDCFEIHCDLVPSKVTRKRRAITVEEEISDTEDQLLESQASRVLFSVKLHHAVFTLLMSNAGRPCNHDVASAFVVPRDDVFTTVESGIFCANPSDSSCALVSSHGNRSRQLLSLFVIQGAFCSFFSDAKPCCLVLQEKACLACVFELARRRFQQESGKYGAAAIICNGRSSKVRPARISIRPVRRRHRPCDIIGTFAVPDPEAHKEATRRHQRRSTRNRDTRAPSNRHDSPNAEYDYQGYAGADYDASSGYDPGSSGPSYGK